MTHRSRVAFAMRCHNRNPEALWRRRSVGPPPSPQCLHNRGRFQRTREDASGLRGGRECSLYQALRPEAPRHQPVSGTCPSGFDSRRLHQTSLTLGLPKPRVSFVLASHLTREVCPAEATGGAYCAGPLRRRADSVATLPRSWCPSRASARKQVEGHQPSSSPDRGEWCSERTIVRKRVEGHQDSDAPHLRPPLFRWHLIRRFDR